MIGGLIEKFQREGSHILEGIVPLLNDITRYFSLPVVDNIIHINEYLNMIVGRNSTDGYVAKMNDIRETMEHWAFWSLNVITGCTFNCSYCYAKKESRKYFQIPNKKERFNIHFWLMRLLMPYNTPNPINPLQRIVFVGSMSETFDPHIPDSWIHQLMVVVRQNPQFKFVFLSKNPMRMGRFNNWPENAWPATSIDTQARMMTANAGFSMLNSSTMRIGCFEPLLEEVIIPDPSQFNWIIIGGPNVSKYNTNRWIWVKSLVQQAKDYNIPVYMMNNLRVPDSSLILQERPYIDMNW